MYINSRSKWPLYSKLETSTNSDFVLRNTAISLLNKLYRPKLLYRSVGVELKKLSYNEEIQQSLFETLKHDDDKLSRIIDDLEQKFGKDVIKRGM